MAIPESVTIVEVSPRDGLQNEPVSVRTGDKIAFISMLSQSGLQVIEPASFVSPKRVPQMADGSDVVQALDLDQGVRYPVLVPNEKGYLLAKASGARHMAFITSASETFSQKNSNCSKETGLQRSLKLLEMAQNDRIPARIHISCAFDCPYEGIIQANQVINIAFALQRAGCHEIIIADTIGKATPNRVFSLLNSLLPRLSPQMLGIHFHDTYGQALANILAALQCGVSIIDSSVAGLGGCPFAIGASGNVATEDLLFMLDGMGIKTGVEPVSLLKAGEFICTILGRTNGSKVAAACNQ